MGLQAHPVESCEEAAATCLPCHPPLYIYISPQAHPLEAREEARRLGGVAL
jgi:hypothetical protein